MLSSFILRRHKPAPESADYWYEIIERVKQHPLGIESERHVALVCSEVSGGILVAELNRQRREGIIEGMARFAWWKDGTEYVGTCGRTLKDAIADLEKE